MIWKIGDRAVFCYRPSVRLDCPWSEFEIQQVGKTGTVRSQSWIDPEYNMSRVDFMTDDGLFGEPLTSCLAPIIEDPYAAIPKGEHVHA